jgi:hypothetical protein
MDFLAELACAYGAGTPNFAWFQHILLHGKLC